MSVMRNKVGLWTGTAEDGRTVVVTSLEVQAVAVFARNASEKLSGDHASLASLATSVFLDGVSKQPDGTIARMLMVAKEDARRAGVPLIELSINGDEVDLVPPEDA